MRRQSQLWQTDATFSKLRSKGSQFLLTNLFSDKRLRT